MQWSLRLFVCLKGDCDNLKKETFQMRISKDTRSDLDRVAKHYNLSASATVDMLIAKETRLIDKQRKEDEKNG